MYLTPEGLAAIRNVTPHLERIAQYRTLMTMLGPATTMYAMVSEAISEERDLAIAALDPFTPDGWGLVIHEPGREARLADTAPLTREGAEEQARDLRDIYPTREYEVVWLPTYTPNTEQENHE